MADDAEWHTVPNHKQPTNCPKSQKQSKPKIQTKEKKLTPQPMKEKVENPKQANEKKPEIKEKKVKENKSGEKTCSLENKSTGDSKKPEKKSTGASRHFREKRLAKKKKKPTSEEDSDTEEEEGTAPKPLPPYHTTTFVSCPFKDCETPAPFLDTTSLVNHLKEHHLVFKNLHHMYNSLDAYLKRWAKEFEQKPLEEFGKKEQDVYIIDPEKCNLDKEIREQLQRTTLNEVLKLQQHEREVEAKCSKKCLFCKIVGENRTLLFKHMFSEHNFNIGLPDNLVYVNEFLDTLGAKLSNLQCLYCEKIFTSPAVLRKHMRKKKHFKIAAKNRQYDRFYIINYLEPGKNWESFEHDHGESDDGERGEETWDDWEEEPESTMCLFDTHVLNSPKETLEHMKNEHAFDLSEIRKKKELDFYQTIVLINYIRHQSSLSTCFSCGTNLESLSNLPEHLKEKNCIASLNKEAEFWKDPKYLMPTYENDPLLTGFEDSEDSENEGQ